jgi:hypothetical protein
MQHISSTCFSISYTVRTIVKSYGEYPGKLLAENRCMKILEEFLLGKEIIMENSGLGTGTSTVSKDLGRIRDSGGEYFGKLRAGKQGHQQMYKDP